MAKITTEFTDDGIGIIRMLNGQNRINNDFLQEFNSALDEVLSNKKCKALITTSEGKFYSNGLDLQWISKQTPEVIDRFRIWVLDTSWRIMHFPIPTVAALNGHTFAAGACLAIAHDYRVMREDRGWISWNEVRINRPIGENMHELLKHKLRNGDARREAVVFGRSITAPEAKKLGIVDTIVPLDQVLSEAKRVAKSALGNNDIDRDALAMMKKDVYVRSIFPAKL